MGRDDKYVRSDVVINNYAWVKECDGEIFEGVEDLKSLDGAFR